MSSQRLHSSSSSGGCGTPGIPIRHGWTRALDLVEGLGNSSAVRGRVLGLVAVRWAISGGPDGRAIAQEAVEIARVHGDRGVEAEALK